MTRRLMNRSMIMTICLQAMTAMAFCQTTPKLKTPIEVANALIVQPSISEDEKAATVILRHFEVSTNEPRSTPLVVTRTHTIDLPIEGNDKPLSLRVYLQGWVSKEPGADVSLVVRAGCKTAVVDLSAAKLAAKKVKSTGKPAEQKQPPKGMTVNDSFEYELVGTLPANARPQVTLFALAEKDNDHAGSPHSSLQLDILTVEIGDQATGHK